jgi:UDP:flavonoid glycosyltransferase YjiC (YdhE family)
MRTGRFLLATIDGGGTIPPEVGLARRLVERGHQVLVLADPTVEKEALAAECTFTPWRTAPHFRTIEEQTALMWEVQRRSGPRQFVLARDQIICGPAERFADDVVTTVREHGADAVLAEAAVAGILAGAEATGLPTAALMANIYLRPTPGLPQVGTGWSPARGPIGRFRDALVAMAIHRLWATGLPTLNDARAAHGLSPVSDVYEQLDHCARVLVMTSPSFDFPVPALPPNVRYVGPQLDDPNWAGRDHWRPAGEEPLVLVSMSSTFQSQIDPLLRVADGLGQLPVRALVTTGPAVAPEEVQAPPTCECCEPRHIKKCFEKPRRW